MKRMSKVTMKSLLIIGAGGMGREVVDMIRASAQERDGARYTDIAFIDDALTPGSLVYGVKVAGDRMMLGGLKPGTVELCVAVGDPLTRREIIDDIERYGHRFATIIDPTAMVRPTAIIGEGVLVSARAFVSCNVSLESHAVVSFGAIVGHDAVVGRYAFIGPRAVVCGAVRIAEGAIVGAGASLHPGVKVGRWAKVAVGAAAFGHVEERATMFGNPARPMLNRRRTGAEETDDITRATSLPDDLEGSPSR